MDKPVTQDRLLGRYLDVTGFSDAIEEKYRLEFQPYMVVSHTHKNSEYGSITMSQLPPMSLFDDPSYPVGSVKDHTWTVSFDTFCVEYTHEYGDPGDKAVLSVRLKVACDYVQERYIVRVVGIDTLKDPTITEDLILGAPWWLEKYHVIRELHKDFETAVIDFYGKGHYSSYSYDPSIVHWMGTTVQLQDISLSTLRQTEPTIEGLHELARRLRPEMAPL